MAIAPIPPVPPLPPAPSPLTAAPATGGGDAFTNLVTNAVDALQSTQSAASSAEVKAAAGQGNLADVMIAATKASLETQVTTDVLDKALTSYNAIMNMTF